MKKCNKCKIEKSLTEFNKDKHSPDGIDYKCKDCRKSHYILDKVNHQKRMKNWRDNNKDYFKKYFSENKDVRQAYHKDYWINNKDVVLNWRSLNPTYHKDYYYLNKDYILTHQSQRDKNNPHLRRWRNLLNLTLSRLNQARKHNTQTLLGYSASELKEHLENQGMDWNKHDIDHKVPITWFISETPPYIVNDLRNLQPLDKNLNKIKSNKYADKVEIEYFNIITEWIREEFKENLILINYENKDTRQPTSHQIQ